MRALSFFALAGVSLILASCGKSQEVTQTPSGVTGPIQIMLDLKDPSLSRGVLPRGEERTVFKVGFGRNGVTCAGTRFEEGYTPLGRFKVNGIMSAKRFVMDPELIAQSGKTEEELSKTLFSSMNSIDFSGDGETGEYGSGYVSLAPVDSVEQPFAFNTYDGKFRWYSFAIHGSNNDKRIGEKVTGGCLNVAEPVLQTLLEAMTLGQEVVVSANGPCTP